MTDAPDAVPVKVWDPFVRLYHWSQAALIAAAWITADEWKWLHERIGYAVMALVALRLLWGIVGPRHARFADFVRGPRAKSAPATGTGSCGSRTWPKPSSTCTGVQ